MYMCIHGNTEIRSVECIQCKCIGMGGGGEGGGDRHVPQELMRISIAI